jgi:hypothetical protein
MNTSSLIREEEDEEERNPPTGWSYEAYDSILRKDMSLLLPAPLHHC